MRKFTFKSLLIAAALCLGTSAWAQTTYYYQDYEAEGATVDWKTSVSGRHTPILASDDDGNTYLCADPTQTYNNGATLTGPDLNIPAGTSFTMFFDLRLGNSNSSVPSFVIKDDSGNNDIFSIKAISSGNVTNWAINGDNENPVNLAGTGYVNNSIINNRPWYRFKISLSDGVTYLTITNVADGTEILPRTMVTTLSSTGGLGIMYYYTNKNLAKFAIDNVVVRSIEEGDLPDVEKTTYTIKYNDEEGNVIAEDKTIATLVGLEVIAETDPIYTEGVKYIFKEGDTSIITDLDPQKNIINLVYRKAETWNYTVQSSVEGFKVTGSNYEGDVVSVAYPRLINVDGTLYTSNTATNKELLYTFNLDEADKVATINFTATDITGVIFFSEAEDIQGLIADNGGQAGSRSSMKQGAFAAEDTEIVTLLAGKYKLSGARSGNTGVTFAFVVNGATVSQATTSGSWGTFDGAEFNLIEESTIVLKAAGQAGNNSKTLDYIYIQKIGEATTTQNVTVGSNGIATFTPSVALDFTNTTNIKAYTATVSETTVTLTETKTVAAGEGVIIKSVNGGEATESIAVANPATATEGNALVGTLVDIDALATDVTKEETVVAKNYILNNGTQGIGFYLAAGKKVAAGKAYLQVPVETAAEAKALTIVWNDGETTGINSVETVEIENGNVYDLSGRKVANPAKGLYIKNGKKFIVK